MLIDPDSLHALATTMPEALERLPEGYEWTMAGSDGAWCAPRGA